jgi:hypothetical protein
MGKASSAKKVARAARAGGSRRAGQRRALGFPALVTVIVVVGVGLVGFARQSRDEGARPRSAASEQPDHWHAAYGVSKCGQILFDGEGQFFTDAQADTLGIHTHGDGVIHIHPFVDSSAGRNARLGLFFDQVGLQISDSKVTFPNGDTWDESKDTCPVDGEDEQGEIVLAKWNDAQDAADGEKPNEVVTDDFGATRFQNDREYYQLAFVAESQLDDIPVRPDLLTNLNNLVDVGAGASSSVPGDTSSTAPGDTSGTSSTVPGDTATTAPGDTSATTATTPASDTSAPARSDTTATTAGG